MAAPTGVGVLVCTGMGVLVSVTFSAGVTVATGVLEAGGAGVGVL